jgi:hypothetical protein
MHSLRWVHGSVCASPRCRGRGASWRPPHCGCLARHHLATPCVSEQIQGIFGWPLCACLHSASFAPPLEAVEGV